MSNKIKSFLAVLLAAGVISLGLVLAEDADKGSADSEALQKVIENQEKILEKLEKIEEDVQFIKNKLGKV